MQVKNSEKRELIISRKVSPKIAKWGKTDFYVKLLTDKDPNSVPLSSLVHFKTKFDPKWQTRELLRKQLILLLSSDWLISIQNGKHAYCIGNTSFCCCALIG